jgi:hypothetical protein
VDAAGEEFLARPVSPLMTTLALLRAALPMVSRQAMILGLSPMMALRLTLRRPPAPLEAR